MPKTLIRPLHAEDRDALNDAFGRLGTQSRYRRFLHATPALTPEQLRYLTDVDQRDHVALAALDFTGAILGVARFIRIEGSVAEPAIAIVDDHQGRGLGTALMAALVERARSEGVTQFHATVLAENEPILRLLRGIGALHSSYVGTALQVTVDLSSGQAPAGAKQLRSRPLRLAA